MIWKKKKRKPPKYDHITEEIEIAEGVTSSFGTVSSFNPNQYMTVQIGKPDFILAAMQESSHIHRWDGLFHPFFSDEANTVIYCEECRDCHGHQMKPNTNKIRLTPE